MDVVGIAVYKGLHLKSNGQGQRLVGVNPIHNRNGDSDQSDLWPRLFQW
jgi:hypothetical protein